MSATIFISAVSSEFHKRDPAHQPAFVSYRDVLTRSLRRQIPNCEIVVQEELKQSYGDLLDTLDGEVQRSTVVVHVVGRIAGARPEPAELRRLRERHPDLLAREPELGRLVGESEGISYTQWEAYLAFHHGCNRLVFVADDSAPRSPSCCPTDEDRGSQESHVQRIRATGEHYQPCYSQSDMAIKTVVAIERHGLNPTQTARTPTPEAVAAGHREADQIIVDIATAVRNAGKTAVTEYDPAGVEAFLRAVDTVALKRELDRREALGIVAKVRDERRQAVEQAPTPENYYDLAFAELAAGNYHDAIVAARQFIDREIRLMSEDQSHHGGHQDRVLSGHLLWRDAALYAGLREQARQALEEGGRFIDVEREPVLWADFHEELAEEYLDQARFDQAEELIDAIVDIREEHQPEPNAALATSLLLWSRLLQNKANHQGAIDVSARAERIFAAQLPPDESGVAVALGSQAWSLEDLGRYSAAEVLLRRALAIEEASKGPNHLSVAALLNSLAHLLLTTHLPVEAEPLLRRALAIDESSYGPNHPCVATVLNNLAHVLRATDRLAEAEPLLRRALAIDETYFGNEHPNVAIQLNNLGMLLDALNHSSEAEPLLRRSLAIDEARYGNCHPDVAIRLHNLALLLKDANRLTEAEPLARRALTICAKNFGIQHPNIDTVGDNYTSLLRAMNLPDDEIAQRLRTALEEP